MGSRLGAESHLLERGCEVRRVPGFRALLNSLRWCNPVLSANIFLPSDACLQSAWIDERRTATRIGRSHRSHRWVQMDEHQSTYHSSRCPFHLRLALPLCPCGSHLSAGVLSPAGVTTRSPGTSRISLFRRWVFLAAQVFCLFLEWHDISGQKASAKRAPLPMTRCSRPKSIGNGSSTYRCVGRHPPCRQQSP